MKVALIAGQGLLPVEALKTLKAAGHEVLVITFTEEAVKDLSAADKILTFSVGQVGKILKSLKSNHIEALAFLGKVSKTLLETNLKLDLKAIWMLARLKDRQENTIMYAIVAEIEKLGIKILSQLELLKQLVPGAGVFTKKKPDKKQLEDIAFGYEKARGVAGLDIGQAIIIKHKAVLAIESIEGTAQVIARGASFTNNGGYTFVKVAKPQQDVRFDIPVIGMETLANIAETKGAVVAFEADKTLIIEMEKCVEFANEHGIILIGYKPSANADS